MTTRLIPLNWPTQELQFLAKVGDMRDKEGISETVIQKTAVIQRNRNQYFPTYLMTAREWPENKMLSWTTDAPLPASVNYALERNLADYFTQAMSSQQIQPHSSVNSLSMASYTITTELSSCDRACVWPLVLQNVSDILSGPLKESDANLFCCGWNAVLGGNKRTNKQNKTSIRWCLLETTPKETGDISAFPIIGSHI